MVAEPVLAGLPSSAMSILVGETEQLYMLCERCKKNEASIHLSEMIKDHRSEVHLCEVCAREVGLNTKITSFSLSLPEMLTFLDIDDVSEYSDGIRCGRCGMDIAAYKRDGRLGCSQCYSDLKAILEPVLAGIHGENRHIGKFPANSPGINPAQVYSDKGADRRESVESLLARLEAAVTDERYEEAAVLRDMIRDLKNSHD